MKTILPASIVNLIRLCSLTLFAAAMALSDGVAAVAQSSITRPLLWTYSNETPSEITKFIALSAEAKYLAMSTSSPDKEEIYLFDLPMKNLLWKFTSTEHVTALDMCTDGTHVVSAFWPSDTLRLFSNSNNMPLWEYTAETGVETVVISGDGSYIAAAETHGVLGETDNIYLLETLNRSLVWSYTVGGGTKHLPALSYDGSFLAITSPALDSRGATLNLLEITSNIPQWSFDIGYGGLGAPSISDDGSCIAVASSLTDPAGSFYVHQLSLFHCTNSTPVWSYIADTWINHVAMSGDGNYIVASTAINYLGDRKANLLLFEKNTDLPLWRYKTDGNVSSVVISNNGHSIVAVIDGSLHYFDRESAEPVWAYGSGYGDAWISGDGRYAVASQNGGFSLFDTSIDVPTEVWVDDDYCTNCENDGHQWGYDAFNKIQEAVESLWQGGTVHVASGTYYEASTYRGGGYEDVAVFIARSNVKLLGEARDTTVIESDRDANRVLIAGKSCEVRGFTIKNSGRSYAGISVISADGTAIIDNSISDSGYGIGLERSAHCTIGGNIISGNGLGIIVQNSHGTHLHSNRISHNDFGLSMNSNDVTISNCVFAHNDTGIQAGNCSGTIFLNNTVADNVTGMYTYETFFGITNSIFWNNQTQLDLGAGNNLVTYSNIKGGWPGEGNINVSPQFVDASKNDYHLKDHSPCIGVGACTGIPTTDIEGNPRPNPQGSFPDMGAYESDLALREPPPLNVFGVDVGNECRYEGTMQGEPYMVKRTFTTDMDTFPVPTLVCQIEENGQFSGREYYQVSASQILLWGATVEQDGAFYDLRFSRGLPGMWFPSEIGEHQYSTSSAVITQFPEYSFDVSIDVVAMAKETVILGFDSFEAYKMRYQIHVWGYDLDYKDFFTWWVVPYIGVIKDEDSDSEMELTSFSIGEGTITSESDADRDGLRDYQELFKYGTDWLDGDTDDDHCPDGPELQGGRNPLVRDPEGDLNMDCAFGLQDAILGLRNLAGYQDAEGVRADADLTGDNRIGIEEVIYVLQRTSGLR